jgi:hypothetical protein
MITIHFYIPIKSYFLKPETNVKVALIGRKDKKKKKKVKKD